MCIVPSGKFCPLLDREEKRAWHDYTDADGDQSFPEESARRLAESGVITLPDAIAASVKMRCNAVRVRYRWYGTAHDYPHRSHDLARFILGESHQMPTSELRSSAEVNALIERAILKRRYGRFAKRASNSPLQELLEYHEAPEWFPRLIATGALTSAALATKFCHEPERRACVLAYLDQPAGIDVARRFVIQACSALRCTKFYRNAARGDLAAVVMRALGGELEPTLRSELDGIVTEAIRLRSEIAAGTRAQRKQRKKRLGGINEMIRVFQRKLMALEIAEYILQRFLAPAMVEESARLAA